MNFDIGPLSVTSAILLISILTFNGLIVLKLLLNKLNIDSNILIDLGGAIITGPLVLLLILSLLFYIFKGYTANWIIFWLYFLFCLEIFRIKFKKDIHFVNFFKKYRLLTLIVFIYLLLMFLYSLSLNLGADAYIYSGIATSFVRGNYPTSFPWQPDFLSVYHHGTFVVEGSLQTIFKTPLVVTHLIFSAFLLFGIFLISTGLAFQKYKSIIAILPAVFGLIIFSGPLIPLQLNLNSIFQTPQFSAIRASSGGGASSLFDMVLINFYTFGLACFFLFIFLLYQNVNTKIISFKYLTLIFICLLTSSIDETLFLVEIPLLFFSFLFYYLKKDRQILPDMAVYFLIFICLFFLIQNPIRDSILTPSPDGPRFSLLTPYDPKIPPPSISNYLPNSDNLYNLRSKNSYKITETIDRIKSRWTSIAALPIVRGSNKWLLLRMDVLALIILILAVWLKSKWSIPLVLASILSFVYGLLITNNFWYSNFERFFNQSAQLLSFAAGFIILDLISKRNKSLIVIGLIFFVLFIPQLISAHIDIFKQLQTFNINRFNDQSSLNKPLSKITKTIPYDKRIIFADGFPFESVTSFASLQATTLYGIFVPMSPPGVKVIYPEDIGTDWYDAMSTLDPVSFANLKVDYLYLLDHVKNDYPESTQLMLNRQDYFKPVFSDSNGTLYLVSPSYKTLKSNLTTLRSLEESIPNGSTVYIDNFYSNLIPKTLILALARRTKLFGFRHATGGGNYMYIEKFLPYYIVCNDCTEYTPLSQVPNLEYIFADPKVDPQSLVPGQYTKLGDVPHISLWKKIN